MEEVTPIAVVERPYILDPSPASTAGFRDDEDRECQRHETDPDPIAIDDFDPDASPSVYEYFAPRHY